MEPRHGALGVGGGREDEPRVVAQHLEPRGEIGGVILARLQGQSEVGAEEGGAEFGHQLFPGIAGVSVPTASEVAVEPAGCRVQCVSSWLSVA